MRRFGGDTGHLFGCPTDRGRRLLPVGVPAPPPLTTLDMGRGRQELAHFTRQSYLPTHRSHMAAPNHSGPTGGTGGGSLAVRTSINGAFIQSTSSFLLAPSIWCETQTPAMRCQLCSGKTSPAEKRWEISVRFILTIAIQRGNEEIQF